jgi:D-glutamate N-acetyltransferase
MARAQGPRVAILAEGQFARGSAKTAIGVLRYAPYPVVAVIDSTRAGSDAWEHVGGSGDPVPVVASVADAVARGAEVVLIGTASAGGRIDDRYRTFLADALGRGLEVWNGLHERVLDDPALAAAARDGGGRVRELREPPRDLPIGGHGRRRSGATVVLTVGSDAAVGKMTASLEIAAGLRRLGARAEFVATGQTGIAIAGRGIAVDAVVADFIAGSAERLVCEAAEASDWVVVEGQGSLTHPGFSGVTLGLLHGSAPDLMVLCHDMSRQNVKDHPDLPVRTLMELVRIYEEAARWSRPPGADQARVAGLALNTAALDDREASRAIFDAAAESGLPAADPVREGHTGADRLARALLDARSH